MTAKTIVRVASQTTGVTFDVAFYGATDEAAFVAAADYIEQTDGRGRDIIGYDDYIDGILYERYEARQEPQVHCSICDGIGHGQPGYGPCPLEDNGYFDPEEDAREREAQYWDDIRREEAEKALAKAEVILHCDEHDCDQRDNGTGIDHDYCLWNGELPPTESEWHAWKQECNERRIREAEAARCNTKTQALRALHRAWND